MIAYILLFVCFQLAML